MKAPKPVIPRGAPAGTVWSGGPIEWSRITLRISGDELYPKEVSRILGCEPNFSHRKGEPILRKDGTVARIAKTGRHHLYIASSETDEWDCGEAIMVLMSRLPSDVQVWRGLTRRFKADLFVALSMTSRNKGFSLTPEVMAYLGNRYIESGFDIYCNEAQKAEPSASPNGGPAARVANLGGTGGPPSVS